MGNQSNEKPFSLLKKISRKNFKAGILRYAITVFSCVLIIVMGAGILAYASATTIGENIITNILTATGLTVNGTATTTNLIVDGGTVSLPNNSITDAMVVNDITIADALYSIDFYSNPTWLTDLGADKLTGIIPNDRISGLPYDNLSIADGNLSIAQTSGLQTALDEKLVNPMIAAEDLIIGEASGAPKRLAKGGEGTVLGISSGVLSWVNSGVSNFLGLSDTPNSYTGQAGQIVKVNLGETALEFADADYLPLAGGTISGDLTVSGTTALATTSLATTTISALGSVNGNIIYVKPGETIQSVINGITDATAANPYLIMVPPGVYNEIISLTDKSHISITGAGIGATIVYEIKITNSDNWTIQGIEAIPENYPTDLISFTAHSQSNDIDNGIIKDCRFVKIYTRGEIPCSHSVNINFYNVSCKVYSGNNTFDAGIIKWHNCEFTGITGHNYLFIGHGDSNNRHIFYGCSFGSGGSYPGIESNCLLDLYGCSIHVHHDSKYGILSSAGDSAIKMYGGSIINDGVAVDVARGAGTISLYGVKYNDSVGVIGGDMNVPGSLEIGGSATTTELTITGVSGDNKVLCRKSDGTIGACADNPTAGVCTCE